MNCLLDTHILIWAATSSEKLFKKTARILLAPEFNIFVSMITLTFYRLNFTIHRDPFDRMLAWQAIRHDLTLMTQDPAFQDYLPSGLHILR
jgi:PIN domain nuclease of toxin-antitoxin system